MRPSVRSLSCLAGLALVASMACHRIGGHESAPEFRAGPSDGNIVAIILAENNTDLSYARLVPSRARSAEVQAFAQRMLTDHTILNAKVNDIAQRNGIKPEDDAASLDFRDRSADRRDVMRELDGARFDSTYAANEVQYHTDFLTVINTSLATHARNAELREFVSLLKPAVSAHLAHAEQMRAALATKK
jgi:putative membrane protein